MSEREYSKAEIDAANELANYHLNELVEGLIPDVEELSDSLREDIRRRLIQMFYDGLLFAEDKV